MKKSLSPIIRISLILALATSSTLPAFAQIRISPVSAAVPGSAAAIAGAGAVKSHVPTSIRLNMSLGSPSLAPMVAPVLNPQLLPVGQTPVLAAPAVPMIEAAPAVQAASLGAAAPAEGLASELVPGIELSEYSDQKLGEMSSSGAHEAGSQLIDAITRTEAAPVSATQLPSFAAPAESGLSKAKPQRRQTPAQLSKRAYSPWRLNMFLYDPEKYALTFLFGADDRNIREVKGYELLVGDAVHQAFEDAYKKLLNGTPGKDIRLSEIIEVYDRVFDAGHKSGGFTEREGWKAAEYKRRGHAYIQARYEALFPFTSQGKVVSLEERLYWTMTDPVTKKSYQFKGIVDRLMVKDDTVYIRDWKTHFAPPTLTQLERDDFQLGLYAIALKQAHPELVKGRKIVIVWDFKEFSQEIVVDDAYEARIQAKVFDILRKIDTFTQRVEAERPEWLKRLRPAGNPRGLKRAREAVDELGAERTQEAKIDAELRALRKEFKKAQEGLTRFAVRKKLAELKGKRYTLRVAVDEAEGAVPTKGDHPEDYEAVAEILKKDGKWDGYSRLDPSTVRKAAESQGGEDHAVFRSLREHLPSGHANEVEVYDRKAARDGAPGGGVVRPGIERDEWAPDSETGVLSATQLDVFLRDKTEFTRRYVLRGRDSGPKPMGILAGSAIHETMEQLFAWIKGGRIVEDIHLNQVYKHFDKRWEALSSEGQFEPGDGLTAEDYQRGSKEYIKAKWDQLYPFDQGRPVFLEKRMFFTLADPKTGKTYKFQGIPDRVMIEDGVVLIRDWKSHYNPPSDEEVRKKDYQLGLYVLALRQLYPDLMKGRKARLIWDFKDKQTVIEVDDKYVEKLEGRIFTILRGMDSHKARVEAKREQWEEKLGLIEVPQTKRAAAAAVDKLGRLGEKIDALEQSAKTHKGKSAELELEVAGFSIRTGWVRVWSTEHNSRLIKRGVIEVPTKGKQREAYDQVVATLKDSGVWEKYSSMDYAALKRALADPEHPDRAVLKKIEPHLKSLRVVRVKLSKELGSSRSAPKKKAPAKSGKK